jgi:leucyl aminopeptidase
MKFLMMSLGIFFSGLISAQDVHKEVYVTIGTDAQQIANKALNASKVLTSQNGISLLKIDSSQIESLSHLMHEEFNRCGGFMFHDSLAEAMSEIENFSTQELAIKSKFVNYEIKHEALVHEMIDQVDELSIRAVISKLESFHNRFYKAQSGIDSSKWIAQHWEQLVSGRNDAKVELYNHPNWPQASVILTIEGSEKSDEIVVIGGHADSIVNTFFGRETARAPGADDNASGVATFTEVIRILVESNFKPKRTLQVMAYAAEEVGLLGSKEIAQAYKRQNKQVVGVLQLDMTNFHGSSRTNIDIALVNDFTNRAQNEFLAKLIDTYLQLPWNYTRCGYACSDHASWTAQGYPASAPFEAMKNDMNNRIHTANDLLSHSGGHAEHAKKFARLAVAYMVELTY